MDLESLKTFITFAQTGSFTRTAALRFKTQSAISMQMKKLQGEVGQPLYRQHGRQLKLTPTGLRLLSHAQNIVQLHDAALLELQHCQPDVVRLGCPADYAETILPLVVSILSQHTKLQFKLCCLPSYQLLAMLDDGQLDLAVVTRKPASHEGHLLLRDYGVWVAKQTLQQQIGQRDPSWSWPLALFEDDCQFHQSSIAILNKAQQRFHLVATSSQASALFGLARQGLAVTVLARSSVPDDLAILDCPQLEALPSIDIVLQPGSANLSWLDTSLVNHLQAAFDDRTICP
ncbi:LysR family transcriptional regulator [Motilimonas pumila]|uniref:LysR family transcriptional regulator n=1 Tax=Motilimonas pumila TaxID=2303987 RepID=A0A418YHY3_9GAMM|nr:LysR family transcriptional regulator [Motilimonas pumila]RJG49559.1 LysR family transcriptional regulator [Motilimonas pumila]